LAGEDPGAAGGSALAPVALEPAQAMRQAIARLMARSKREIPHYYLSNTVDMTAATRLHQLNGELTVSERIVQAALLLKATAVAARQVPDLNGYWDNNHLALQQEA
jgi:pyruvate dehydrogenase E2 component (dihydrolipoyllysine-residue acetyltransferase)